MSPRRILILRIALVLAAYVWLPGCATNQITGERHVVLTSRDQERQAGLMQAKEVAEKMGLVRDPQLVSYVTTLGTRLVRDLPRSDSAYTFQVVDIPEPNAFALPGGFIYISRGLLALVNSEDELVAVLGHEIGHVAARHAGRRATVAAPIAAATRLTSLATGLISTTLGRTVAGVGGLAGGLALIPYSRDQEREADRLGMELAARGGWNPAALARILKTMQEEERLRGGESAVRFSFLATHPSTPERVLNVATDAPRINQGVHNPVAMNRAALLRNLDGLLVGSSPGGGVLVDDRFLHPELNFSLQMPPGWTVRNERAYLATLSPDNSAAIVLRATGHRGDLQPVVQRAADELGLDPDSDVDYRRINGMQAAQITTTAQSEDGVLVALLVTWIAHRNGIFEIAAITDRKLVDQYRPTFAATAESLRPMTAEDRGRIHTTRLRLHTARYGDTIRSVAERAGSAWDAELVAVINGIEGSDRPLPEGFVVKVAVDEPYLP